MLPRLSGQSTRLIQRTLISAAMIILTACSTTAPPIAEIGVSHIRTGGESSRKALPNDGSAKKYAEAMLPFARVASRTYCDYLRKENVHPEACDSSSPMVEQDGWIELFDSRQALPPDDQSTRLTFLVFFRVHANDQTKGDIIFGFRGTKFTYASDWYANFRWITRFLPGEDQYEVLYKNSPGLISKARKEASLRAPQVTHFDIYSTGHSLGGGLAQLFAYSDTRVRAAVVFDPSPVTGYSNLVTDDRVNCDARILRIYERGEALQYVRSVMRLLYTPSENVAEIDFDLIKGGFSPITNHSIKDFTDRLSVGIAAISNNTGETPLNRVERRLALTEILPTNPDHFCITSRKQQ